MDRRLEKERKKRKQKKSIEQTLAICLLKPLGKITVAPGISIETLSVLNCSIVKMYCAK